MALNLTHVVKLVHKQECSRVMFTVPNLVEDGSAEHLEGGLTAEQQRVALGCNTCSSLQCECLVCCADGVY